MIGFYKPSRTVTIVVVAAISLTMIGVYVAGGSQSTETPERFWAIAYSRQAVEAERYNDYEAMAAKADAVVLGHISGVEISRQYVVEQGHPDIGGGVVTFALVHVSVEQLLRGSLRDGQERDALLEVFLTRPQKFGEFERSVPRERGVFFLRDKELEGRALGLAGEALEREIGYYRLVNSAGVVHERAGAVVIPRPVEPDGLRVWQGGPFPEFLEALQGGSTRP